MEDKQDTNSNDIFDEGQEVILIENEEILVPRSYVGIECLQEQMVSRMTKEGFSLNVLLVGSSGVGKSTLMSALFDVDLPDDSERSHELDTVQVIDRFYYFEEGKVRLRLGVVETRGFGDQIDKDKSYKTIVDYVDQQFDNYFNEELRIKRVDNLMPKDTRIHACLYLISPVGHGLHSLDLVTMKQLDAKVNIIPIIAKADSLTKQELAALRSNIMNEMVENNVNIYKFAAHSTPIELPFAVTASREFSDCGDRQVRARKYSWGTVEVDNPLHSDFELFRKAFLTSEIDKLIEMTHRKHYQKYRNDQLEKMGLQSEDDAITFVEFFKAKEDALLNELKNKEDEMKRDFAQKAVVMEEMHRSNSGGEKSKIFKGSFHSTTNFWKNITSLNSDTKTSKKKATAASEITLETELN